LDVLKVGEEAVVDLDKFASETSKGKNFKSKVKKFEKEGYALERLAPPHSRELVDTVESVSNAWLSLPGRRERGFSLGWFEREEVEKDNLFVLKNPQQEIIAFVNQVPSYAPGEASIDMMRHKEDVPNGTMDYLFTKLLTALKQDGYKQFSLGLAALSGVGDQPGASMEERAIHQIYEHMNRFFSYKGLRQYKNKFNPVWKASYLVYENGPPGLIKTALAITRAGELSLDDMDD
jgi:phosphatidylglycerol lysyltransferase